MSDNSSDHFFSALEILSDAALGASTDLADHQAPIYADDSILMCSLPETPCSDSTPSGVIPSSLSPLMGQTVVPSMEKEIGAEISSQDFDDKKQDNTADKECIKEGSRETISPMKNLQLDLESIIKILSKETDPRFGDIDILEIAKMRGIHFTNPKWWRPGGYGPKKDQNPKSS